RFSEDVEVWALSGASPQSVCENGRRNADHSLARLSRSRAGLLAINGPVNADRREDRAGGPLNPSKGLGQGGGVTAIEVDIVARRVCDVEAECVSNHEPDCFGFQLAGVTQGRS